MKIIEETNNRIILKAQSYLPIFLIGLLFVLMGVGGFLNPYQQSFPLWLNIIFVGFGLFPIIFGKQVKVIFDKSAGQLIISKKGIHGTKKEDYNLSEIKKIIIKQDYERGSQSGSRVASYKLIYFLIAVLDNNIELSLESSSRNFFETKKIAEKLSAFLGTPFMDIAPPSQQNIRIGF